MGNCIWLDSMAMHDDGDRDIVTPPLLEILKICEVKHEGSLASIVDATQEAWVKKIRPGNTERWEISADITAQFEEKRDRLLLLLQQSGFVDPIFPQKNRYDQVLILGTTMQSMLAKVAFVNNLFTRGGLTVQEKISFLTGNRNLNEHETSEAFFDTCCALGLTIHTTPTKFPRTEMGMAWYILHSITLAAGWTKVIQSTVPISHIDWKSDIGRSHTVDTLRTWLAYYPNSWKERERSAPQDILVISEQPYCKYQDETFRTEMPHTFTVETVGKIDYETQGKVPIALYLDSVARYLYQAQERKKRSHS